MPQTDELIVLKANGNPEQFALKLDVSESTLYALLKVLKNPEAPVKYDNKRGYYFYKEKGTI